MSFEHYQHGTHLNFLWAFQTLNILQAKDMWEHHNTTLARWSRMFLPTCYKELWIILVWFFWYLLRFNGVFCDKKLMFFILMANECISVQMPGNQDVDGSLFFASNEYEYLFWGRTIANFDRCIHNFVSLFVWFSSVTVADNFSHLLFSLSSNTSLYLPFRADFFFLSFSYVPLGAFKDLFCVCTWEFMIQWFIVVPAVAGHTLWGSYCIFYKARLP